MELITAAVRIVAATISRNPFDRSVEKRIARYPPEAIAAVWRCADKVAAARVEYAIKKSLSRAEKETLIAAPETIVELLPQLADLTLEVVDITNIEL